MTGARAIAGLALAFVLAAANAAGATEEVRIKDLGRFLGWRENALVGYGIVTGLAGSGDSPRSAMTRQALSNALSRLGANVSPDQVQSRNVAAVIITATLPPSANVGDRIDVTVSSIGDARSLAGGALLMTPLVGPDQHTYALAQGALVVGGYRFDSILNRQQKNYPAGGVVPGGATVETSVQSDLLDGRGQLTFVLKDADATTAERVAAGINAALGPGAAHVRDAGAVNILAGGRDVYGLMSRIEDVAITPDALARVVINERSGTVVAGGNVRLSSVVVSQGDIRISVNSYNEASQPLFYGGYSSDVRSLIVTNTKLEVSTPRDAVASFPNTTVADLVEGLARVHVDTRGVIAVLQAVKAAGALHADIIVQ
jgi:flagellar P-ring protein precursor FlgI